MYSLHILLLEILEISTTDLLFRFPTDPSFLGGANHADMRTGKHLLCSNSFAYIAARNYIYYSFSLWTVQQIIF